MRSGGSKEKGAGWEREICGLLSLWISEGKRRDLFWRSAMSGGRATIALRKGHIDVLRGQAGDVSAISGAGEVLVNSFLIEAKFYNELQLTQGLLKDNGTVYRFWRELIENAKDYHKYPFLIAKQNNMPAFCLLPYNTLEIFGLSAEHCIGQLYRLECYMLLFEVFLREAKLTDTIVYLQQPHRVKL